MDFSKTVNLPKTSFPMKGNLPVREPEIEKFWRESKIYERMKNQTPANPKFILHDGPPYANGHIHIGHALNKILKDIIVKHRSLQGMHSPYVPGWDCHGLPIEQQLLKDLKADKSEIDPIVFRKKAAEFARKFVKIQKEEFMRLGVFGDWEKPYLTLESYYESAIVKVFGELVKKGLIYRKKKPVYWCPTCQTALADAEVEYADHISHSVIVKFPVITAPLNLSTYQLNNLSTAVLIWTTTPWTLPANVALAFNPEEKYVIAETQEGERWILAQKRQSAVVEKTKQELKIIAELPGAVFEGIICSNPLLERNSVGVTAEFVSMEDGTGIVHIAPGHGVDDYMVGLKYNLPVISPVDDKGVFTSEAGEFNGHKVFAANHLIIEKLKEKRFLVNEEQLTHSYPHCWRCHRAIIFRATEQWFMDVNSGGLKKKMLEEIEKINWIPGYGKNRISSMVEQRPDWCLSRQRLWGTPIPVFYCESCDKPILDAGIIDGIAELFKKSGSDAWFQNDANTVIKMIGKENFLNCPACGSDKFRKEKDIFDVWFDSGVSSFAVLNKDNFPELSAPSQMYLEGSDQHRGWFQTSLIPSVALRGRAPYENVLTHGFVVDGAGKKMSKSQGNVVSPQDIIKTSGADILRLWVAASDYSEDVRISKEILGGLVETYRKIRNTLKYILGNISDMPKDEYILFENRREADKYIFARCRLLSNLCKKEYSEYQFHKVIYHVNNFCVNDLSSFYFDISKDCLYTYAPGSFERRSLQSTLEDIFLALEEIIAPILSFTAEDAWRSYKSDRSLDIPGSVFLFKFPAFEQTDAEVHKRWEFLIDVKNKVNLEIEKKRAAGEIGSSLECEITFYPKDEYENQVITSFSKVVDFEMLFIVSGFSVGKISRSPDGVGTRIEVKKSVNAKCVRCWSHRESVGKNSESWEICDRCFEVVKGGKK